MRKLAVVLLVIVVGFAELAAIFVLMAAVGLGVGKLGEVFRAHIGVFTTAWLFMPGVGIMACQPRVRENLSVVGLRRVRVVLICAAITLSFAVLVHFERYRDDLGRRLDRNYGVGAYEDVDGFGRPYRGTEGHSDHTAVRVVLYIFEWGFLAVVLTVPVITGISISHALALRATELAQRPADA